MPRASKIIGHYQKGIGKHNVERWSAARIGPHALMEPAADNYIDVFPYLSLQGFDDNRTYKRPAGVQTHDHMQATFDRTRGKRRKGSERENHGR